MSVHTVVHERTIPVPPPMVHHSTVAIEDLSYRYKALIEAERKHFLAAEQEYNEFSHKMNIIHQELEASYDQEVRANHELRADNEELVRRIREMEFELDKKGDSLRKIYFGYCQQAKQLQHMEVDNVELRAAADYTVEDNYIINTDFKNIMAERNYLDERLADVQSRHTHELSRLNTTIAELQRSILERDREIERLKYDLRNANEESHRLRLDVDALRRELEDAVYVRDRDIAHLKRLLDDQRPVIVERPASILDSNGNEETIHKLKLSLEEAYRTIEELQRRKPAIEIIEKPKIIEKIIEKPVERIVRVPVEREVRHSPAPEPQSAWDEDTLERLVILSQKPLMRKMKHLYYIIWKLLFHITQLEKVSQSKTEKVERVVTVYPPRSELNAIDIYHFLRRGIVENIFEVFVRSANHAHQKKVNSLILFIINVKEIKAHHTQLYLMILETYFRMHFLVKPQIRGQEGKSESTYAAIKKQLSAEKKKTSDAEFRDMTNSWIVDTLENVKKRRGFDRHDPTNMEYLYLFRLLAIKYRIVYPLRGKPFEVDADLAIKLEHKICKALRKVVEFKDIEEH